MRHALELASRISSWAGSMRNMASLECAKILRNRSKKGAAERASDSHLGTAAGGIPAGTGSSVRTDSAPWP